MANWLDGSAIFRGHIEDILSLITTGTSYLGEPVSAQVEENYIVFPKGFVPEDIYLLNTTRAFLGFWWKHDINDTLVPHIYEVSVIWDQLGEIRAEDLSSIAKKYNLYIEVEGIIFDLELKQHVVVNNSGEILLDEETEYHHEDYDIYDDYKKIR